MQSYLVTHYYHSGFSVACGDTLLVFDYWLGEGEELAEQYRITPETLAKFSQVYVFISHDHPDHMDPVVFTWKDLPGVQYIVSSDMPVGTRGRRMAPGDTIRFSDEVEVTAFDSTDLGVSFLVDFKGLMVFHAGDLNFWHWRDESTMRRSRRPTRNSARPSPRSANIRWTWLSSPSIPGRGACLRRGPTSSSSASNPGS